MEALLSKRVKTLAAALALLLLVSALLLLRSAQHDVSPQAVLSTLNTRFEKLNAELQKKITRLLQRGKNLKVRLIDQAADNITLFHGEALVVEDRGRILQYYGEMYFVPQWNLLPGQMTLVRKDSRIFLHSRVEDSVSYITLLCDLSDPLFSRLADFPLGGKHFVLLENPLPVPQKKMEYDPALKVFFVSYPLESTGSQLLVRLKFYAEDVMESRAAQLRRAASMAGLAALLLLWFVFWKVSGLKGLAGRGMFSAAFFLLLFLLIRHLEKGNLFLRILGIQVDSIWQLLVTAAVLHLCCRFISSRIRNSWIRILLADLFFAAGALLSFWIVNGVEFNFTEFSLNKEYLALLFVLLSAFTLPLWWLRHFEPDCSKKQVLLIFIVQAAAVTAFFLVFPGQVWSFGFMCLAVMAARLLKRGFVRRLTLALLVSCALFGVFLLQTEENRRNFIDQNLKNIFINQGNYAKLIVREIVHEMNSRSSDFSEFFRPGGDSRLREIWRNSLASRENIPSGIYALSGEGKIISAFSHQVPYIRVNREKVFPVWAVEEVKNFLFGREISLALASIGVFRQGKLQGMVFIQVLSSPELILKLRDKNNIFALEPRLGKSNLNYIKLNDELEIVENPGHINIRNIRDQFNKIDQWVSFSYMGVNFSGYVFQGNRYRMMIYFPIPRVIKNFSQWIRLFIFCFLIITFSQVSPGTPIAWKRVYYSFSIQVFVILVAMALIAGITFSLFSLNYHSHSEEISRQKYMFEQGRILENIVDVQMGGEQELSQNNVFFLARMVNQNVNVFYKGELEFVSDIRQVIESRVPEYLNSVTLDMLDRRNQKYVLEMGDQADSLYFRKGDYIFQIDFRNLADNVFLETGGYADFMITMIFLLGILGFAVAQFFRNRILAPINKLNQGMDEVKKGRLALFQSMPREHELRSLFVGYNSMVEGIGEQKRNISEISRMKTLVNLGRRVAHEIKNPLTPIRLSAQQISRSLRDRRENFEEVILKSVQYIVDETEHLRRVSYGFLDLSKLDELKPEQFDLPLLIREEVENFRRIYPEVEFSMVCTPPDFTVTMDPVKIRQMMKNLIMNSLEAFTEKQGRIDIACSLREPARVALSFRDNGAGMGTEELNELFRADFSTKEGGTGLGMFIIQRIVDLHNGSIRVRSNRGRGTEFNVEMDSGMQK